MPLDAWICDSCNDAIVNPQKGLLIWRSDADNVKSDLRLVHKGACDPKYEGGFSASIEMHNLLGIDGQAHLFALVSYGALKDGQSPGVANMDNFVDVFRRLQTPYYEEARQNFHTEATAEEWGDANEVLPYTQRALRQIAEEGED